MPIKLLENSSFALMRTNPKLTTNVKVIADSKDRIYLESFDANTELSKSKYKAFRVTSKDTYDYDLSRFYSNGKTPSDIIFDVERRFSDLQVNDDFGEQYEFNYAYGATSINSKSYSEEFGILAPIWLERTIPDYFIVFRIDGPVSINNINIESENENKDFANDPYNFVNAILKNSTIIKTFDLSEKSEQGKYIRNYRNSERFPIAPLNFSTGREESTTWQGIDISKGGFVSKGEFAYDSIFGIDSTIIENEHFITQGFERNKIAIANIMNLQFLFDDESAEDFTINRYFGLYVNSAKEGIFQINGEELVNISQQVPLPKNSKYICKDNTKSFIQSNKNGITIPILKDSIKSEYVTGDIDNDSVPDLFEIDFLPKSNEVENLVSIFYVKDKQGKFYNLKTGATWVDGKELKIQSEKIDWADFTGHNKPIATTIGRECANKKGSASTFLTINSNIPHGDRYAAGIVNKQIHEIIIEEILPGDIFSISDGINTISVNAVNSSITNLINDIKNTWVNSGYLNFDRFLLNSKNNILTIIEKKSSGTDVNFTVSTSSTNSKMNITKKVSASLQPFTITADQTLVLNPGEAHGRFFNPIGTNNEIAKAMTAAFNNIKDRFYTATQLDNKIVLVAKLGGRRFNDIVIARDTFLSSSHVEVLSNTKGFTHPDFTIYQFEGGSEDCRSRTAVSLEMFDTFSKENRYLKVINRTGDSNTIMPILKTSYYIDEPIKNKKGEIIGYNNFDTLCTVNIKDGEIIYKDNYKNIYLYDLFSIEYGRFSIFPIKDMDFDFYSTEYSNERELKVETEFYSTWGSNLSNKTHADVEDFFENKEFSTLQSELKTEDSNIELSSTRIESEYDRLKENSIKELTVPSRVVPYINKWVYRNGKNVRDLDYRLSSSEAFGTNNFSPSKEEFERDSDYFTHEWYYLQKLPPYFGSFDVNKLEDAFSYFPEEIDVTSSGLLDINYDYFTDYFTVDMLKYPILDTTNSIVIDEVNVAIKKQIRYSLFEGGSDSNHSTAFHRGVKVIVKERVENDVKINFNLQNIKLKRNNRFNNYKFSCVLIPHDGTYGGIPRKRTEIEFIENRKYKSITLVIYANVKDVLSDIKRDIGGNIVLDKNGFIDRTILYTLKSQFISTDKFDMNTDNTMNYADIELSGSIDMRYNSGTSFINKDIYAINNISDDSPKFLDEITLNENGNYNKVIATTGPITREFQVEKVYTDNHMKATSLTGPQPIGLSEIQVKNGTYIYEGGGFNYWNSRLNSLSYAAIADLINTGSSNIKYTSILEDGTIVNDLFIIELQTANVTIKPSYLTTVDDTNKPVNFNLSETIGHELTYTERGNVQPIYRHSGYYQPKFNDIISFEDPYITDDFANILERDSQIKNKLKDINTQFKIDENFSKIKNMFYHKINDVNSTGVLELTSNSAFMPLYPIIGEIAIDKSDMYLWKSNWDAAYFKRSITKNQYVDVIGTRSIYERKSFFASKIMKILDDVIVDKFKSIQVNSDEDLILASEEILREGNEYSLAWYDNGTQIILNIFLEKELINVLSNSGILSFFEKYIKPEYGYGSYNTLIDDVKEYIKFNIIPRYTIGEVDLYTKKSKDEEFNYNYPIVNSNLSNIQKLNIGLVKNNEFDYSRLSSRSNFNIKLIYNKTNGYNYSIAPSFKIIKK